MMPKQQPGRTRVTVLFILFALIVSIASQGASALVRPGEPGFTGCVIVDPQRGPLNDVECDKVPDVFDNCPLTFNPTQADVDRNGIGDACDLVIDEIRVEPETPIQGRSMVVTASLINNRAYPMRNMVVKLDVPKLGVSANNDVAIIQPGERVRTELLVRIPECAPSSPTDLVVIAEYPVAPGQNEVFSHHISVPVAPSGACAQETGSDKTVVNILEVQDITPENGALYPFTIHNTQSETKAYVLGISGLEDWGASEIHPGTVIVVPSGESRDGALQVWARPGITGKRSFTFTVQAKDDTKQIVLLANIPESVSPQQVVVPQILVGVFVFIFLLLLAGVVIYFLRKMKRMS